MKTLSQDSSARGCPPPTRSTALHGRCGSWLVAAGASILAATLTVAPAARGAAGDKGKATAAATAGKERARELFARGQAAFEAGDFAGALALFEEAYGSFPAPALYFNIAQCHRKLNSTARALDALQRFLEEDKNIPAQVRAEVDKQIAEAHAIMEAEAKKAEAEGTSATAPDGSASMQSGAAAGTQAVEAAEVEQNPFLDPIVLGAIAGGVVVAGAAWAAIALASAPPESATVTGASLGTVDLR